MNQPHATLRTPSLNQQASALALALVMTLGALAGLHRLAQHEAADAALLAQATATARTPA